MPDKPFVVAAVTVGGAAVVAAAVVASQFAFFYLPFAWTREPQRLASLLGVGPGSRVADIGAGSGALAIALTKVVGPSGEVVATELKTDRQASLTRLAKDEASNLVVVAGAEHGTNLTDGCCDAIVMRTMFHHVSDRRAFARDVVRSLKAGGRVAVIDFAPGDLWFHGHDHGVAPEDVEEVFTSAGCIVRDRIDRWGGPTFLRTFQCGPVRRGP
jgi:ubiquinone/menaquinone biosynthesis C-methylase UbiE